MQARKSQTVAKNTDMKPNFRPFSSPPAGLQREKTLPKKSPPFYSVVGKNKIVPN